MASFPQGLLSLVFVNEPPFITILPLWSSYNGKFALVNHILTYFTVFHAFDDRQFARLRFVFYNQDTYSNIVGHRIVQVQCGNQDFTAF